MTNDGLDAFEVIVTLPLAAPAVGGVKVTLNPSVCPAVRVSGAEIPLERKACAADSQPE
jgi:hypothetical protein